MVQQFVAPLAGKVELEESETVESRVKRLNSTQDWTLRRAGGLFYVEIGNTSLGCDTMEDAIEAVSVLVKARNQGALDAIHFAAKSFHAEKRET